MENRSLSRKSAMPATVVLIFSAPGFWRSLSKISGDAPTGQQVHREHALTQASFHQDLLLAKITKRFRTCQPFRRHLKPRSERTLKPVGSKSVLGAVTRNYAAVGLYSLIRPPRMGWRRGSVPVTTRCALSAAHLLARKRFAQYRVNLLQATGKGA
jgi:hypothetical protein